MSTKYGMFTAGKIKPIEKKQVLAAIKALKNKFSQDEWMLKKIKAILIAIKRGDAARLDKIFNEMASKEMALDNESIHSLAFIAAAKARVSSLEVMMLYFSGEKIKEIPLAKFLLQHPLNHQIENFCGQYKYRLHPSLVLLEEESGLATMVSRTGEMRETFFHQEHPYKEPKHTTSTNTTIGQYTSWIDARTADKNSSVVDDKMRDYPYRLVSWLLSKTPEELEVIVKQDKIASKTKRI